MSYGFDPILDNIWVSTSGNDGRTWQLPTPVIQKSTAPLYLGDGTRSEQAFFFEVMAAVRTYDDLTLVAIDHHNTIVHPDGSSDIWTNPQAGARAALAILNYINVGTSEVRGQDVIFKRAGGQIL